MNTSESIQFLGLIVTIFTGIIIPSSNQPLLDHPDKIDRKAILNGFR
jgi:hypothetical protein